MLTNAGRQRLAESQHVYHKLMFDLVNEEMERMQVC
jgi:hypothetical protein